MALPSWTKHHPVIIITTMATTTTTRNKKYLRTVLGSIYQRQFNFAGLQVAQEKEAEAEEDYIGYRVSYMSCIHQYLAIYIIVLPTITAIRRIKPA